MNTHFFAIIDNQQGLIWGVGCSPRAAWRDSEEWTAEAGDGYFVPHEYNCKRITRSLYERVSAYGGDLRYDTRADGVYTIRRA